MLPHVGLWLVLMKKIKECNIVCVITIGRTKINGVIKRLMIETSKTVKEITATGRRFTIGTFTQ